MITTNKKLIFKTALISIVLTTAVIFGLAYLRDSGLSASASSDCDEEKKEFQKLRNSNRLSWFGGATDKEVEEARQAWTNCISKVHRASMEEANW